MSQQADDRGSEEFVDAADGDGPDVEMSVDEDLAMAAELERLERKPPLYRFFRGTLYGLYMLVAVWLVAAIAWSAYLSVWGEPGQQMKQRETSLSSIQATPFGSATETAKPTADTDNTDNLQR